MSRRDAEPQTEAAKYIYKALKHIEVRGHSRDRVFRDWLDLMLLTFLSQTRHAESGRKTEQPQNEYEDAYLAIVRAYDDGKPAGERSIDRFADAMGELSAGIAADEPDPLGDLYMAAISYGEHGQYFTPSVIADLMAQAAVRDDEKENPTIGDISGCGSGVMLMAVAKIKPKAYLVGIDLDERCAKMTTLNLLLRGYSGRVYWGNGLSGEMYRSWTFHDGLVWQEEKPTAPTVDAQDDDKPSQLALL